MNEAKCGTTQIRVAQVAHAIDELASEVSRLNDAVGAVDNKTLSVQLLVPEPIQTKGPETADEARAELARVILDQVAILVSLRVRLNGIISRIEL